MMSFPCIISKRIPAVKEMVERPEVSAFDSFLLGKGYKWRDC